MVEVGNGNAQGHGAGSKSLAVRAGTSQGLKQRLRVSDGGSEYDGGEEGEKTRNVANTTRIHDQDLE
jgi:hypothetical protein